MSRIILNGYFGWRNMGDEAVAQAIIQQAKNFEVTLGTSLPFNLIPKYQKEVGLPVVHFDDVHPKFDAHLCGLGGANFDTPWKQIITSKIRGEKLLLYGSGVDFPLENWQRAKPLLSAYYKNFDAVTVRSLRGKELMDEMGVESTLTMDPAINLEPEPWDCPKGKIVVAARYPDLHTVNETLEFLIDYLRPIKDEIILVPFASYNMEDYPVDHYICEQIKHHLGAPIFDAHPVFDVRKTKYLIGKSKKLITNGRYHSLLFAISEGTPYELIGNEHHLKYETLMKMDKKFTLEQLKQMERKNLALLEKI